MLTLSESDLSCDGCKRLIRLFTARCLNMESAKDHLINDKVMSEGVSLHIINQIFFCMGSLGLQAATCPEPFCDFM